MSGFSLVELLVVMAIVVILLTMAGSAMWQGRSKSGPAGATLASCIEFARSQAVARNRVVWLRIAPDRKDPADVEIRFFRAVEDGAGDRNEKDLEFRRPVRLEQMAIRSDLPEFGDRPKVEDPVALDQGGTVVIRPSGESALVADTEGFPEPPETLVALSEIGLQATRGNPVRPIEEDAVAVQILGLSGRPVVYKR